MSHVTILLPPTGTNEDAGQFPYDVLYQETGWDETHITAKISNFPSSIHILRRMRDVDLGTVWSGLALRIISDALHDAKLWDPKEWVILRYFFVWPCLSSS